MGHPTLCGSGKGARKILRFSTLRLLSVWEIPCHCGSHGELHKGAPSKLRCMRSTALCVERCSIPDFIIERNLVGPAKVAARVQL
jgi:hypothetical protein